jgi:hypothetical protein
LPYKKVSGNEVDYSTKNPTGGTYIADRATAVYYDSNFKEARVTMPRYTVFTVHRKVDGGFRISYKTSKGTTVTGYIKNVVRVFLPINYGELLPRGDVDRNGQIDAFDYIRVKRSILKSLEFTDDETVISDINDDAVVNQFDYILIKRHVLKTYTIEN